MEQKEKAIKNIAVFVCGMDEEYPFQIIQGINQFAREHSINVSYFAAFGGIVKSSSFDAGEYSIFKLPDLSLFDGALLMTNTFSNPEVRDSLIERVKKAGIPSVIFECKDHETFHDISINNYSVMKKLVEHLIKVHGARVFHYISGPFANPEATARYKAFRDALSENGIEFDEEKRLYPGFFRSYDGIKAIEDFEKSGLDLPDAFVCANDSMALTAMSKLQDMGYRIPEDVIVTGFDNILNARNSCPTLTTVKRPLYYSGEKSCETLYALINGEERQRSVDLESEPVFAESCGCGGEDAESIRDFKRDMYLRLTRTYTSVHMLNRVIAELAGAENITECVGVIRNMLGEIECEDFDLCLVSNWETTYDTTTDKEHAPDYPEKMTAPLIWKNGEGRSVEVFESRRLRPEPLTTGGNISYFIPLHFGQRILGYYIMTNTDFPITSIHCHTIAMSIGNAIESISKLNVRDPLCGIYNRNGFNHNAGYIFRDCVMNETELSVLFIDMDGLKSINDTYGHKEGDAALKDLADAIHSSCRSVDVCGRIGGDEFIVLGKGTGFADQFEARIMSKLEKKEQEQNRPYRLSASVGSITIIPKETDTLLDLIQRADDVMYEVKKRKKHVRTRLQRG